MVRFARRWRCVAHAQQEARRYIAERAFRGGILVLLPGTH